MSEHLDERGVTGADYLLELARHARLIVGGGLAAGLLAVAASFLFKPIFTSATVLLPPAQQQSSAIAAIGQLGALANLAGGAGGGALRSPLDQYVALLTSTTVVDRMIDRFKLMEVYDEELRLDARKEFRKNLRVSAGRRDGLISIEVDDEDPQRAQQMAAAMVDEFRFMTSRIAVTEAQQRRMFFEKRVAEAREGLVRAQAELQRVGFTPGNLKAEPKAVAETYAKLRAEVTTAQAKLQALLSTFTEQAPEVQQQRSLLASLNAQLRKLELSSPEGQDTAYLSSYREFKYQEVLFELFSRQYEAARVDEGREGGVLQVVDAALVPEKKSSPKRALIGVGFSVGIGLLLLLWVMLRFQLRSSDPDGRKHAKLRALWPALWGRA